MGVEDKARCHLAVVSAVLYIRLRPVETDTQLLEASFR